MSERREKIHIEHELPKTRRCALLDVARSTAYYRPEPVSEEDLALMRLIDEIHLQYPFYGSRRMRDELDDRGHMRIPGQADHRIQSKPITRSSRSRSLNPVQADQRFRWQADQFLACTGMVQVGRPEGVSDAG